MIAMALCMCVGFSGYQTMSMSERKMKESERDKKGEDEYYEKHKK